MNAGQLIEILSKFPPDTPVLKTNTEDYGYDEIPDTPVFEFDVTNAFPEQDWQSKYSDAVPGESSSFKAIIL